MKLLLGALFIASIGVTLWGFLAVPADARFPVSYGVPPSIEGTVKKPFGLGALFLIQAAFFPGSFVASDAPAIQVIGALLMAFFLLIEVHLIRRLR